MSSFTLHPSRLSPSHFESWGHIFRHTEINIFRSYNLSKVEMLLLAILQNLLNFFLIVINTCLSGLDMLLRFLFEI